jgi:hypothetical protein
MRLHALPFALCAYRLPSPSPNWVSFTAEGLFAIYRIFDNEPEMVNNPSAFALTLISCGNNSLVGPRGTANAASFNEIKIKGGY